MGREYLNLFLLQGLRLHFLLRNQSYFPTISQEKNMLVTPVQAPLGTHKATTPATDVHVSECSLLTASLFRVGPFSTLLCRFQGPAGLPRYTPACSEPSEALSTLLVWWWLAVLTCPLPLLYVCVCVCVLWSGRRETWFDILGIIKPAILSEASALSKL